MVKTIGYGTSKATSERRGDMAHWHNGAAMRRLFRWLMLSAAFAAGAGAQPAGYAHNAVLSINHSKTPNTDQTNFPVLITAQANSLKGVSYGGYLQDPSGYDILFTSDSAGTNVLPYQRVRHDLVLGRIVYFVQVPILSHTADTPIYLWYGNPNVTTDQSMPAAVWDANYKAVWHLNESSNTTINDSTSNGHTGTSTAQLSSALIPGKIPNLTAVSMTSKDHIDFPSPAGGDFDFTSGSFTFSFWLNSSAFATYATYFGNGKFNNPGYYFQENNAGGRGFNLETTVNGYGQAYTHQTNTWYHIAISRSGGTLTFYVNGAAIYTANNFGNPTSSSFPFSIGGTAGTASGAAEAVQEFRVSNVARSADWIATEYANESSPATFFSSIPSGWDMTTTAAPPVCNAGIPQSFRAGYPATLDGTGSYSLTGLPLIFLWQQIPSNTAGVTMQRLHWSSHTESKPTITGLVFGPADFQLTVTQSDGESSTCMVNDGAVVTDDNGAVIVASGNSALDNAVYHLLGPMVQLGKNAWPFYDTAAQTDAAIQIAGMDTAYGDYWNTPGPGTVAMTPGSLNVVGNGTTFTTTFCQGATGSPAAPIYGASMVVYYPTNNPNVPGQTGRRPAGYNNGNPYAYIQSCTDDTHLTLNTNPWYKSEPSCPTGQTAPCWLQYSAAGAPAGNSWYAAVSPANFYDQVSAYYALYYRSGLEVYLKAARKLADRYWTSPTIDMGNAADTDFPNFGFQLPFVEWETAGMVLRALDTADGHPDMWAGLHKVWNKTINMWLSNNPELPSPVSPMGMLDARAWGYGLAQLAECALFDTDLTYQQTCRTWIKNSFATSGPGALNVWPQRRDSDGGWKQLFYSKWSWDHYGANLVSPVTLQYGSAAVTCTNANCGWTSGDFANSAPGGTMQNYIWFTAGSQAAPQNNASGDRDAYCGFAGHCTFVDANHFTLDRPYDDASCTPSCTKGYIFGSQGVAGWGQETFYAGILGWGFDLAGRAMVCTGSNVPIACDNPTSTLAYQYSSDISNWMIAKGYDPVANGVYYYVDYPGCNPPTPTNTVCTSPWGAMAEREYFGDGVRGLMVYYQRTGDQAAKTFVDSIYAGLWGKPGTSAAVASPDGTYDNSFDNSCSGCGYWLYAGLQGSKLFGQMFGFSRQDNWPVIRSGGVRPPRNVQVYVSGRPADVAGAVSFQVIVTEATGIVDPPVVCSSSPCAVTVNAGAGNPMLQVQYLSSTGVVVHSGERFVVNVN